MSISALRQRQTVNLTDGKDSSLFKKFLEGKGLGKIDLTIETLANIAESSEKAMQLNQQWAITRQLLLEQYKQLGKVGLDMLDDLMELDTTLNHLREKYKDEPEQLLADDSYRWAMEQKQKINKELSKLNFDKTKFVQEQINKGDTEILDVDFTKVETKG